VFKRQNGYPDLSLTVKRIHFVIRHVGNLGVDMSPDAEKSDGGIQRGTAVLGKVDCLLTDRLGQKTRLRLPMDLLVTRCAEGDQILGSVIAQSATRTNVMDLKILHPPTRLAAPAVSLQDFTAELAISFKIKLQAWMSGMNPGQSVTCTFSRSCCRCAFGRPIASRVRQGNKASRLPVSRLTPARKSAQIISRQ